MKKSAIKYVALALACVVFSLLAVIPMQSAEADRSAWLADIGDGVSLSSLSIPGTHDSGALHSIADISGKCQSLSIGEQLKAGVRFLDIRLQLSGNKLKVVHSFVDQMTDFEDVLTDIVDFIRNNESEFLLISIKEDADPTGSDKDFTEVLEDMLFSYPEVSRSTSLPSTVGEARGKIHIISRYADASIGLPCYRGWVDDDSFELSGIYVQDNYRVESTEEKLSDISAAYSVALRGEHALVLNFTSCYLASGFPPIYAGLPAHKINKATVDTVNEKSKEGPLGVLVCDFMTSELADAIIGRNFR